MHTIICANIRIYVFASDSTYTNIQTLKSTQTHTQPRPPLQTKSLIGLLWKTIHSV